MRVDFTRIVIPQRTIGDPFKLAYSSYHTITTQQIRVRGIFNE